MSQPDFLETEIITFAKTLPYWARYISEQILSNKKLEDIHYSAALKYFKEDHKLKGQEQRPPILINEYVEDIQDFKEELNLVEIKNIMGVNALVENQCILLSPQITVVYGANGSGKTGYIRILNNAFFSRSNDKEILPNVNIREKSRLPECEFSFFNKEGNYTLKYPKDKDRIEFKQFAVFDCKSVLVHLNEKNNLFLSQKHWIFLMN